MSVKKKPPKDTLTKHKDKAWRAFSIYIRTRDCLRTTSDPERGTCVTCNRPYHFKQLQAGHWIPGRNNAVLFSERGVHAQCYGCNYSKSSNPIKYWLFMEQTYGRKIMDLLILESEQTVIYNKDDYDNIRSKFKLMTKDLIKGRVVAVLLTPPRKGLPF